MTDARTSGSMSTGLLKVAERARRDPQARILALARLLDEEVLKLAFGRIRKGAAVGVDGVTKEQYAEHLEDNLRALHDRMKAGQYRHQPIRRVHIPKAPGQTRPIGISALEDKVVQNALHTVLEAIYEQDFLDCSYGFRPGRSPHDALRAVDAAAMRGGMSWVLEADIRSFFDSLDRAKLTEMLRQRVADESFIRLVGKCLHVGVLDGEEYTEPHEGTAQGSTLSPILGNIYLHHVLDRWFEREVKPRLRGRAQLIRYADDFIIFFERRDDASRVYDVLPKRMARFGLTLHPDKTRLLPFDRPPREQSGGKGPDTFDFLGFTVYWRRTRKGTWVPGLKTRRARLQRATKALADFCRRHRHEPVKDQHAALCQKLRGHYQYFGVNGNLASLRKLAHAAVRSWFKWLRRRSQRTRLTWERFNALLVALPLPRTRILVQIWGTAP
ncbi:MAG: group II intron reverse transcriptase/maturase [Acidobacteriota bacterium]